MTRVQRLKYCKICTNRKLNLQKGLLCGLTNEWADFEDTCPDFDEDVKAKKSLLEMELRAAGEQGVGDSADWAKNKQEGGIIIFVAVMVLIAAVVMEVGSLVYSFIFSAILYGIHSIHKGNQQQKIVAKHLRMEQERKRK